MKTNSTHPMVSVVIPHYGGFDNLKECIDSLLSTIYSKLEIRGLATTINSAKKMVEKE